jgi:hypothetical protein
VVKEKSYFFDTEGRAGRRPAGRNQFAGRGRSPVAKGSANKMRRVRTLAGSEKEVVRYAQDFACGLRRPHDGSSSPAWLWCCEIYVDWPVV